MKHDRARETRVRVKQLKIDVFREDAVLFLHLLCIRLKKTSYAGLRNINTEVRRQNPQTHTQISCQVIQVLFGVQLIRFIIFYKSYTTTFPYVSL